MSVPAPWLYLDADGFFASCEEAADPALHGRPVGVVAGGPYPAAPLIAVNTAAKAADVRSGDRLCDARDRCAGFVVRPQRVERYVDVHSRMVGAVETVLPVDAVHSIDELSARLCARDDPERLVDVSRGGDPAEPVHLPIDPGLVQVPFHPFEQFERGHSLVPDSSSGFCLRDPFARVRRRARRACQCLELGPRPTSGPLPLGAGLRLLDRAGRDHGARAPFGVHDLPPSALCCARHEGSFPPFRAVHPTASVLRPPRKALASRHSPARRGVGAPRRRRSPPVRSPSGAYRPALLRSCSGNAPTARAPACADEEGRTATLQNGCHAPIATGRTQCSCFRGEVASR